MGATKAQIGRAGELLVQFRLIQEGIDSAPMTTDAGIDLVAFSPRTGRSVTIQVKTNEKPKRGGGKGKLALDWWVADRSPADVVALVDLHTSRVWLLTMPEIKTHARQHSSDKYHLYFYTDASVRPRVRGQKSLDVHFDEFLLERRLGQLF